MQILDMNWLHSSLFRKREIATGLSHFKCTFFEFLEYIINNDENRFIMLEKLAAKVGFQINLQPVIEHFEQVALCFSEKHNVDKPFENPPLDTNLFGINLAAINFCYSCFDSFINRS